MGKMMNERVSLMNSIYRLSKVFFNNAFLHNNWLYVKFSDRSVGIGFYDDKIVLSCSNNYVIGQNKNIKYNSVDFLKVFEFLKHGTEIV